jgi:hypothetical protein
MPLSQTLDTWTWFGFVYFYQMVFPEISVLRREILLQLPFV